MARKKTVKEPARYTTIDEYDMSLADTPEEAVEDADLYDGDEVVVWEVRRVGTGQKGKAVFVKG